MKLTKVQIKSLIDKWTPQKTNRRKASVQPGVFLPKRANIIYLSLFSVFVLLGGRAVVIHMFPASSKSLSKMADRQYSRDLTLARYRGTIFDRRKEPLAISIRTPSVFINPKVFSPSKRNLRKLGRLLKMHPRKIRRKMQKKKYFAWLKRKVPQATAQKIEALKLKGLYHIMEPARYYPAGIAAGNLLGFVGIDDTGLAGIEKQMNEPLSGEPIKMVQSKDARGNTIFLQSDAAAPETSGDNVYLTIDRAIQEIAEEALAKGIRTAKAKAGFAIVSDPHTGKILAVANVPTFNPNSKSRRSMKRIRNIALTNTFEPGSVFKPFIVAAAMEHKLINERSKFDCESGKMRVGGRTISDAHKPKSKYMTTTEIVVHSSNVCTYKIAKLTGPERVNDLLRKFGFGEKILKSGFPGEASGYLQHWEKWRPIRFANIAFGQGVATTGLEIVQAYGAIANGGILMQPYIVDRLESSDGEVKQSHPPKKIRRAIHPNIAKRLRNLLRETVESSAVRAKLASFTAGGKTGTTQKIDKRTKAYSHTQHLAGFAGIAPINDPHIVIYVQIDDPNQKQDYGALWAAPVFAEIGERTLRYLNVAPDKKNELSKGASVQKARRG